MEKSEIGRVDAAMKAGKYVVVQTAPAVRAALGDGILDWEYGSKGLDTLIKSFYLDYFPNVEWLQKVVTEEPERLPIR